MANTTGLHTMTKKVKQVMSADVAKIDGDRTVLDAARLMAEKGVGCVIVTSGIHAFGIVTERDLVSRILLERFDPAKVLVKDIATTPLFTIKPEQTVKQAAQIMTKYKVRRLPVVDKGSLMGIVTANDLAKMIVSRGKDEQQIIKALARAKSPPYGMYR